MMKFNGLGNDVLQLKEAFLSDYPDIVKRSLLMSAERLKESGLISNELFVLLENDKISFDEFKSFCLKDESLLKSKEALIQEYEEKRIALSQLLNTTLEQHKIHSHSYLEKDSIVFVKTFYFGYKEAMEYFGLKEDECLKMFEPHGFVFQFTALRFPQVIQNFIKQANPSELFYMNATPVFYVKDASSFAIDFVVEVKIDTFENHTNEELVEPILEVIENIGEYVAQQIPYHEEFDSASSQKERYGLNLFKRESKTEHQSINEELPKTTNELAKPVTEEMTVEETNVEEEDLPVSEDTEEMTEDKFLSSLGITENIDLDVDLGDIDISLGEVDVPTDIDFDFS